MERLGARATPWVTALERSLWGIGVSDVMKDSQTLL
jgi:hypothetical protein